ncbi:TATA box-binding protein [Nanoarchaeota archaeon]|nr:MAG: TATA box-binding protein [Nanoarchaeota archaeon]
MGEVREVSELFERVHAHSHIRGLGLEGLKAKHIADGLVGQEEAREAAGIIVKMIKEGRFAGKAVLIAGPPGSGKTAIAVAIAKELGEDVPFVPITASEIYSAEIKKTEFLTQAIRSAIGVRIRDKRTVYEGKVEEVDVQSRPSPFNPYIQVPISAKIVIVTKDEKKKLTLDEDFTRQLVQLNIKEGDVIMIDEKSGRIVRVGVAEDAVGEEELRSEKIVPVPEGPVRKEKEFVYTLTLHQLDTMHSRSQYSIFDMIFGGVQRKEISEDVRKEVDKMVKEWVDSGKAELIPGVLFIDEASLLDIETFAFLNRALEQELSPIIIFATNRGVTKIRGTDAVAPHGMPLDLLDRLLIIVTRKYLEDEIREIIRIRAKEEKVNLTEDALEELVKLGSQRSLRYAVQLLTPCRILAETEGRKEVSKEDVIKASKLFVDVKASAEYLSKMEKEMIYY